MLTNFLQFPFKNEFVNINLCMKNNLKLSHCIQAVETFHNAFGISNEYSPNATILEKDFILRYSLMKEENEEYLQAAKEGDLPEIADALGDMLYILCGTILKLDFKIKLLMFLKKFKEAI